MFMTNIRCVCDDDVQCDYSQRMISNDESEIIHSKVRTDEQRLALAWACV